MNTWIMALIGIISICLKTILKTRQHCHGGANLGHEIKWKVSQRKPEYVLFFGVRLTLRIQGWALKNARGSALSVNPAVPSVEKYEKNEAEHQSSGAPTLGPLQVWNEILMLRLSVGIWGWALGARFHVFAVLICFIALIDLKWIILTVLVYFEWDWVNMDMLYVNYGGISWRNSKYGWGRVCKDIRTQFWLVSWRSNNH